MDNKRINEMIHILNNDIIKYNDAAEYISELGIIIIKDRFQEIVKIIRDKKYGIFSLEKWRLKKKIKFTNELINNLIKEQLRLNIYYLKNKREITPKELKTVNGRELDENQLNSILVDEPNTLVIAGAGTGKTTTITGKIKYLLLKEKVDPKDILLLTYTKAATEEMKERVYKETNENLDVFTFHKLGKNIITSVEGKVPTLTNIDLNDLIKNGIKDLVQNDEQYNKRFAEYIFYNQHLGTSMFSFDDSESYAEYIKLNPLITLNNEKVKSYEELAIANFLTLNGIKYEYEKKYIIDTTDSEYGQYRPDFYLPKYKIWIEHFGIDRNNNVPSYFTGKGPLSGSQVYNEGIRWKRNIHNENNTNLIETFSYENSEGVLLSNLKDKLNEYNVKFEQKNHTEILNKFMEENKSLLNGLNELFSTIINLLKINRISSEQFENINMTRKENELRYLVLPIYEIYIKTLKDFNEIDFSDMLNNAIDYINEGKYKSKYKYVIVDEFQDMSKVTYDLLIALRKSNNYHIYAVGDDWQSIYRFAGSDVGYITNFTQYFGLNERFFIPNTYRYSQSISNVAGNFVMKNPNQIKKNIISNKDRSGNDVNKVEGYTDSWCIKFLEERLSLLPPDSEVLFLGRYKYDIKMLPDVFDVRYNTASKLMIVKYSKRKDLKIVYRTIHASKGLEADYVFILNNKKGNYGFPSTIQDNSILNYFLSTKDDFKFSEERRLMYVALTRAKKKVWLVTNKFNESVFVKELKVDNKNSIKNDGYKCPKCGGTLRIKTGPYGRFFGCSNYPNCKYVKKIDDK